MNAIEKEIYKRDIPDVLTSKNGNQITSISEFEEHRAYVKKLLEDNIYGCLPKRPDHLSVELVSEESRFCAGKAPLKVLKFNLTFGDKVWSFPVNAVIPKSDKKLPAFVSINFHEEVSNRYLPMEEVIDSGFAVFSFCYHDVTRDNDDLNDGVAKFLSPKRRCLNSPGKIAMWAWAAMRVMDYVQTLDTIDLDNVAVIGHSRLGKTALLAAAFDERFKYAISNDSGCTGASMTRGKVGEDICAITNRFPVWFCKRYSKYATDVKKLPLDQNFLAALVAPRHLLIGSASDDTWADPKSEFITAYVTDKVYKLYGLCGLVYDGDEIPTAKTVLDEGHICYQIRHGEHYLGREDWSVYMNYIKKHMK